MLIAIAVFGLLLVMLGQGLAFGLRAETMQIEAETIGDVEMPAVEAALRNLIAQASPGSFPEPASLKGTASSLSLLTSIPAGADGAEQRVEATLSAGAGQLRLRWTAYRHAQRLRPSPPSQETVLLDGVAAIGMAYAAAGGGEWQPSWNGEALPALVRLQLTFAAPGRHWPPILIAPRLEALAQ